MARTQFDDQGRRAGSIQLGDDKSFDPIAILSSNDDFNPNYPGGLDVNVRIYRTEAGKVVVKKTNPKAKKSNWRFRQRAAQKKKIKRQKAAFALVYKRTQSKSASRQHRGLTI